MKNILSIDIDFLFTDMNKYQKYIDVELTPEQSWQVIEWKSGTKEYAPCERSYDFIRSLLVNNCMDAKMVAIQEHDEIIKVLKMHECKDTNLYNIDYHHDWGYGNEDDELNIENWVKFARKEFLVENYSWITQDDAKPCQHNVGYFNTNSWKDIDINKLPKFDMVVFCTSRHFTPMKYWDLVGRIIYTIEKERI